MLCTGEGDERTDCDDLSTEEAHNDEDYLEPEDEKVVKLSADVIGAIMQEGKFFLVVAPTIKTIHPSSANNNDNQNR